MIRTLTLALGLALAASAAVAQQPPAQPAQYTFVLPTDQVRILATALQDRPYREVAALIAEMQRQMAEQQHEAGKKPDGH